MSPAEASAPPAAAVLRAEHVTKEFGGLVAVADVSFDVPQYSIVSLIGPNGAGKTTLFNMLTRLYRPTQGRILLGDRNITRSRPDVITGHGVARTFQNIRLFGAMTAVENVMIGHHARMRAGVYGSVHRVAVRAVLLERVRWGCPAHATGTEGRADCAGLAERPDRSGLATGDEIGVSDRCGPRFVGSVRRSMRGVGCCRACARPALRRRFGRSGQRWGRLARDRTGN